MWGIIACVVLILFVIKETYRRPRLYPPGPPALPIIGNILSVWWKLREVKYYHAVWQAWSQRYGNVLGLRLGLLNIVVVSGRELIREVSSREVFDGRPNGYYYTMRSFGKKIGLVFSDGSSWSTTRRVALKYLKNFGYGSRLMESNISLECKELVQLRMDDAGEPVVVNNMFDVCTINILWQLVGGKRYELNDCELKRLCNLIKRLFKTADMSGGILNFMPFLRHVIPDIIGYTEQQEIHKEIYSFIKETIEQHRNTIDLKNPRDVIDTFLIEIIQNKNEALTDEELQVVCLDLLEAGMETVNNTAVFMMLHVARNEEVQQRIRREIDEVIGMARPPTLEDRSRMTYTEAVLLETLRISSVAAVGIPHMSLDDTQLQGYFIPKGTFILLAMYDLHNGSHWHNPEVFRPERFLSKDGNLIQDEWLIPFGTGRRRCIGEGLARSELFMFLTHLLQKFRFKLPEDSPPSTEPIDGITLSAKPFKIIFEPRFSY